MCFKCLEKDPEGKSIVRELCQRCGVGICVTCKKCPIGDTKNGKCECWGEQIRVVGV
jgi:hypothetical protein